MKTNALYYGDNLQVMMTLPDECLDLIYIDPPFFSSRSYEVIFGDVGEVRAFEDRWKGGVRHYLNWMEPRLAQMRRLLKPTGSIYLHLDHHAVHYVKVLMDDIFGDSNFLNEIIWNYKRWPTKAYHYQRMHDTILFYRKTDDPGRVFNVERKERAESTARRWGSKKIKARHDDQGNRLPSLFEEEESEGVPLDDVWQIPIIAPVAKERLGYPTQKPEKLLAQMIRVSTNPDQVVADFFCGCGTALAVAQQLKRQWIGCDISPTALRLVRDRLKKNGASPITMVDFPVTQTDLRALAPFEFQNFVVNFIQGTHSARQSGDYGIDGYTVFNRYPIQVKQQDSVGRPEIQKFASAIRKSKKDQGYFFAFSFTRPAYEEASRTALEEKIKIDLITIEELLRGDQDIV